MDKADGTNKPKTVDDTSTAISEDLETAVETTDIAKLAQIATGVDKVLQALADGKLTLDEQAYISNLTSNLFNTLKKVRS